MSNIPSIPPLLCSTPPPIDFGDEDDDDDATLPNALNLDDDIDYGAYTSQLQNTGTNLDVPHLPYTSVQLNLSCSPTSQFPDFQSETAGNEKLQMSTEELKTAKPIEAFNYAISTTVLESNSPPPLEFCDSDAVDQLNMAEYEKVDFQEYNAPNDRDSGPCVDLVDEEEIGPKTEDNISLPSLKFDTLSISSEKFSACSPTPLSLHADDETIGRNCVATEKNETKGQYNQQDDEELHYEACISSNLPQNVVKLEDLLDDSSDDELHSPIKTQNICADENSVDFFAIHALKYDKQSACSNKINNEISTKENTNNIYNKLEERENKQQFGVTEENEINDDFNDFVEFADFQSNVSPSAMKELEQPEQVIKGLLFDVDSEHYNTMEGSILQQHKMSTKDVKNTKQLQSIKTKEESNNSVDDDEFEDFQDFTAIVQSTEVSAEKLQNAVLEDTVNAQEEDSDDEFGDFSDAILKPAFKPATMEPLKLQTLPVTSNSLNDRIKPILDMMFPYVDSNAKTISKDTKPMTVTENLNNLELDAIDTAKALEYRWTKSEIRHSLIRSLGIDSRNILFGDKWSSSMPRFGTTMTLQPLEPLKPHQVNQHPSIADAGYSICSSNSNERAGTTTTKPDVPAVEFDWNSSGLVNPLDASQVHTLLLDLDQLVVVANLDKINLDSSSCRSSSLCTTLMDSACSISTTSTSSITAHILKTTTTTTPIQSKLTSFSAINENITSKNTTGFNSCLLLIDGTSAPTKNALDTLAVPPVPFDGDDPLCTRTCSSYFYELNTKNAFDTCNTFSVDDPSACNLTKYQNNAFVTNTYSTYKSITTNKTTVNHHVDLIDNNHNFDTHNYFTTTTAHTDSIPTTYFNAVNANPFGTNHVTINQYLDCRPKEVSHTRETETIYTPKSGTPDASTQQQQPHSAFAGDDSSKLAVNANINTTAATSAVVDTAATTTVSSIISTDSISNHFDDNRHNLDISLSLETSQKNDNTGTTNSTTTLAAEAILSYELEAFACNKEELPGILTTDHDEVVTTSTFSGPLKETHIYTPSKNEGVAASTKSAVITKSIDFDYEIAAAGIIIDETVVKKEYRDVEYNPNFGLAFNKTEPTDLVSSSENTTFNDFFGSLQSENVGNGQHNNQKDDNSGKSNDDAVFDDEFSDFQSVPPSLPIISSVKAAQSMCTKDIVTHNSESRNSTPTFGSGREMILSPAILLPQAISMESNKPKIEWGDTTANINPEELARIEELFPQPKTDAVNLHKSTPMHNGFPKQLHKSAHNSLSISASIAQKELHIDDDDWSEFVSVPAVEPVVQPKITAPHTAASNNNHFSSPVHRLHQQQRQPKLSAQRPTKPTKTYDATATTDEEWSDFVSSTPAPNTQYRAMPQFNSAAWQNANFYNNPLSFYQGQSQTHSNFVSKLHNNNSATSNYNNNFNKYLVQQQQQQNQPSQQMQLQQQVHVMQDFSTAPPSLYRSSNAASVLNTNTQFQVGSAKVAPSISLIPDLGFIAPAAPTHTAFINTLPKPSFSTKK